MAEQSTETNKSKEGESPSGELRGQLARRLAVAGGLVAVLLGVLAFFDYLANPPQEEAEQAVFTQPVPVAPKKEVSQPVKPAENLPEPPAPEKAEPVAETPPPPKVEAQPSPTMESKPEARAAAPIQTGKHGAAPHAPASIAPSAGVPEATMAPSNVLPPVRPTSPVQPPLVARLFSGFVLQAGVFSSAQRAEELHAKLTLSGVPSTLETRVQVGPFRTRHEAEAAQAKLKELGIETILIPPKSK